MTLLDQPRETPAQIRKRLFNPENGRDSTQLEIISEPERRRRHFEECRIEAERRKLEREERLNALIVSYCESHRRSQFFHLVTRSEEPERPHVNFKRLLRAVCSYFEMTPAMINGERRSANIVLPRQILMYLSYELTGLSLAQIGRHLGGRDHTTVRSGKIKITEMVAAGNEPVLRFIREIKADLGIVESCVADQSGRGEG